jgi:hypothetical protein
MAGDHSIHGKKGTVQSLFVSFPHNIESTPVTYSTIARKKAIETKLIRNQFSDWTSESEHDTQWPKRILPSQMECLAILLR